MACSTLLCRRVFIVLIWIIYCAVSIVFGILYTKWGSCPTVSILSPYLIVTGVTDLALVILQYLKVYCEKPVIVVECVVGLFAFCWLIIGSVWVFGTYVPGDICEAALYYVCFRIMISQYVIFGLIVLFIAFFLVCLSPSSYERMDGSTSISCTEIGDTLYSVLAIQGCSWPL
ncbi:uncharacterized protein O3C94_021730 [Discoglossus pictus]